jgi:hypothetical protein
LEELREAVAEVIGSRNGCRRRVLVEVEPPLLQARTLIDLPPVRKGALEELVAHSTGRFFRQNGLALVSAATWVRGSVPTERVARAVAMELPVAEAIVAGVAQSGGVLADIVPLGEAAPPLSLLPPAERARRRAVWRRRTVGGFLTVAVLWVSCLGGTWWWLSAENRRLAAQLEELRVPLGTLRGVRATMDSTAAMLAGLDRIRSERGALGGRLATLVAALPDSTALTELRLSTNGEARLAGLARQAPRLASTLSSTSGLARVRLTVEGATDSVQGLPWDRFTLDLTVARP